MENVMTDKTLAESLKEEQDALRRRFIHHTRPKRPLSMEEAAELARRMDGPGQGGKVP
jgi:hypothetical protein